MNPSFLLGFYFVKFAAAALKAEGSLFETLGRIFQVCLNSSSLPFFSEID
jgi:hypothetical protein